MNVVLVAPAATYAAFPTNKGPFKPDVNTCTGPVPNDCSMPNPTYWTNFDNLINAANQSGIVPLIAGLIDPLDTATSGTYPDQRNAVAFSRFLAARMSGFAVFYSPGFDDMVSGVTAEGTNLGQVMNAVGSAVKQAAPNYLVTNHLNGRATCSDYQTFRASGWMTFFAFQSSHGIGLPANTPTNTPDPAGTICPRAMDTSETPVQASLRRTWQMPWILTTSTATPHLPSYSPILPAYNVEGPYDNVCLQTAGCTCPTGSPPWCHAYDLNSGGSFGANYVDIRYHIRQAAYESMLSGAYGFTYGVQELGHWYFIQTPFATALQAPAVADIKSVFMNFNSRAGMTPHREWITNNGLDTADDGNKKSALASDGSSLVLAYLPAGGVSTIAISTTGLPGLTCPGSGWTYSWRHAEDNVLFTGGTTCSGSNPIQVTRPDFNNSSACTGYDPQACDWILQIQKTGSPFAQAVASPIGPTLDVWADLSSKDGTSAIHASLLPLGGVQAVSVAISSEGISFQQSPRWTPLVNNYLTVWQAEGWDGSMLGIFGQVLDHNAQCLGGRFQINTTTDQDQQDPAVDSDLLGNAAVVWSSLGQDGDLGGIYGRLFDSMGRPTSPEFQVNTTTAGHQEKPQIAYLPGGRFVVAWQTRAMERNAAALSFRMFSASGSPLTEEIRIPVALGLVPRLIDVMGNAPLGFRLRWGVESIDGMPHGSFAQQFTTSGQALGVQESLP
jgi:hypothetical protein